MDLKEFFKPRWTKLTIFLIVIIFSLFLKIQTIGCFDYCPPTPGVACAAVCNPTPLFFIPIAIFLGSRFAAQYLTYFVVPMLIFWYVVSCAVINIFKKIRKK